MHERINYYSGIYRNIYLYLINKKKGGKANALNYGINFCHGDYIVNGDGDSIVDFTLLKKIEKILDQSPNIVALGGMVLASIGIENYIIENNNFFKNILCSYQDLEYHLSFEIVRPLINKMKSTMLISGALGLYKKDLIIRLGGYSENTVGEDMELVMRIRRYIDYVGNNYEIEYSKEIYCYTELPYRINDLIKQRIRWSVGLTEVLYKYKNIVIDPKYSFNEKLVFWYYVLFGKFSPHIKFLVLLIYLYKNQLNHFYIYFLIDIVLQLILLIIGSYRTIIKAINQAKNKIISIIKLFVLFITFIFIYQPIHCFVRLISVPYYKIKKYITNDNSTAWESPKREKV